MKIYVERIQVENGIIVYSKYTKDTITLDEIGADYEYDFTDLYSNKDNLAGTILRLYGTLELINIMKDFAAGGSVNRIFNPVEFEEDSPMRKWLKTLEEKPIDTSQNSNDNTIDLIKDFSEKHDQEIFLLQGLFDALELDDDLNVLKVIGKEANDIGSDSEQALVLIEGIGFRLKSPKIHKFDHHAGLSAIVSNNGFYLIKSHDGTDVLTYPENDQQLKLASLFSKYVTINNSWSTKHSLLLEISWSALAKEESKASLKDLYLLFNVTDEKFINKKPVL